MKKVVSKEVRHISEDLTKQKVLEKLGEFMKQVIIGGVVGCPSLIRSQDYIPQVTYEANENQSNKNERQGVYRCKLSKYLFELNLTLDNGRITKIFFDSDSPDNAVNGQEAIDKMWHHFCESDFARLKNVIHMNVPMISYHL